MLHAAEIVGRKIVIHGGWDGSEVFNDLWIFNTDSFAWMQPKTTGFGPTARFGHTMSLTGDGRLIMFGGCSIVKDTGIPRYHDDIRQLDTDTMTWTRPRINGAVPSGRYGHSSLLINGSNIIVFGGWGSLGIQNCDSINNPAAHSFHCLDTTTMTWSVMAQTGKKAIKHVYNHSACISNNIMYVFGGYDGRQASSDFYQVELN